MYHLELTDEEVKRLAGILRTFISHYEQDKEQKEQVETARTIFGKVIMAEESCPDCFCEDCTKDCVIKKLGLVEVEK